MVDRVNVIPLTERQDADQAQAAIVQIDEVLILLQELGDVARRARKDLVSPRHRGSHGVLTQATPPGAPRPPTRSEGDSTGGAGARDNRPGATQKPLTLTRRQEEVLNLLAQGLSNRRIGRALHITEQTVKAHLHMVYHKLGVADRTEAVVLAMRQGLVQHQRREDPPT